MMNCFIDLGDIMFILQLRPVIKSVAVLIVMSMLRGLLQFYVLLTRAEDKSEENDANSITGRQVTLMTGIMADPHQCTVACQTDLSVVSIV